MTVRTIPEAAAELRVSPRALTKIIVENGLYIAVSNRKRKLSPLPRVRSTTELPRRPARLPSVFRRVPQAGQSATMQNRAERLTNVQRCLGDRWEMRSRVVSQARHDPCQPKQRLQERVNADRIHSRHH